MRKINKLLFSLMIVGSIGGQLVSCTNKINDIEDVPLNIHQEIKNLIEDPLEFNGEWIFDKDVVGEVSKRGIRDIVYEYLMSKTLALELRNKLFEKRPDIAKKYPDFTLSIAKSSKNDLKKSVSMQFINGEKISRNYIIFYSLTQLQDIKKQDFLDTYKKFNMNPDSLMLPRYAGLNWGQFTYTSPTTNYNFRQTGLIKDNQKRLDYVTKLFNDSPNIKLWGGEYWKFYNAHMHTSYVTNNIQFKNEIFSKSDLDELFTSIDSFSKFKNNMQAHFKDQMINAGKNNVSRSISSYLFYVSNGFTDDMHLEIDIIKVLKKEDIAKSSEYSLVFSNYDYDRYPKHVFENGAVILKIKTWLKYKELKSTVPIEENFVMSPIFD